MNYKKHCEYCDQEFTTSRKHTRTCSSACRLKLHKKGFSNKKVMSLVVAFPTAKAANEWLKNAPAGYYNLCTEESGLSYIYQYTKEYISKKNTETFQTIHRNVSK